MKIAGLIIGIALMVLSGIGILVCLFLVATTNGRISLEESLLVAVPLAVLFFVAFIGTIVAAVSIIKAKKNVAKLPAQ